jgi:hypothetical protein
VPAPKALEPDLELGILRRVRSLIIVIAVIAALVVVAGLEVSAMAAAAAPSARVAVSKRTCFPPAKWRGVHASNYNDNCVVCRIFGPRQVARDNGIRSTDTVTIALRYANKAYRPGYRQAAFEGCLQGFLIRGRP